MKHLTDALPIDKEDVLEKVNGRILNLINSIPPKLSEKDELILRPKINQVTKENITTLDLRYRSSESFHYTQTQTSIHRNIWSQGRNHTAKIQN